MTYKNVEITKVTRPVFYCINGNGPVNTWYEFRNPVTDKIMEADSIEEAKEMITAWNKYNK